MVRVPSVGGAVCFGEEDGGGYLFELRLGLRHGGGGVVGCARLTIPLPLFAVADLVGCYGLDFGGVGPGPCRSPTSDADGRLVAASSDCPIASPTRTSDVFQPHATRSSKLGSKSLTGEGNAIRESQHRPSRAIFAAATLTVAGRLFSARALATASSYFLRLPSATQSFANQTAHRTRVFILERASSF